MDDGSIGNISDRRDHQFSKLRSRYNGAGGAGRDGTKTICTTQLFPASFHHDFSAKTADMIVLFLS